MKNEFEFIAFYSNLEDLVELVDADIHGILVDLEQKGKGSRQDLYNTQINQHSLTDLEKVRNTTSKHLICRINGPGHFSEKEVNDVIDCVADEILVPMIRHKEEVEFVLDLAKDQISVSVMLETTDSLNLISELNKMPIKRCYFGMNDFAIDCSSNLLFKPIWDGTLESLRKKCTKPFGFAGLTHPNSGTPIPCYELIGVMKALKCDFSFLRRSFYKDKASYGARNILDSLRKEFQNASIPDQSNREKTFNIVTI